MKKSIPVLFAIICFSAAVFAQIPVKTLVQISRAEDELRFDAVLENLLKDKDAKIRARAALAAGRIGNDSAIPALVNLLEKDSSTETRSMAAFAIGEIESVKGADAILKILSSADLSDEIRARATEAAGKIAAANAKDEKSSVLGAAILSVLEAEEKRGTKQDKNVILFGITAALRAKAADTDRAVAKFLENPDARVRADAANTLARLRVKNANEKFRAMLQTDTDAVARANAARALGAGEDREAAEMLMKAAVSDADSRVRISAIRSLGSLKDAKSAEKLIERGENLYNFLYGSNEPTPNPSIKNEWLEIATVLGGLLANTNNEKALTFLQKVREFDDFRSPETEIAFARIAPEKYIKEFNKQNNGLSDWRVASAFALGFAEIGTLQNEEIQALAGQTLTAYLGTMETKVKPAYQPQMMKALPDFMRSLAALKPDNLTEILRSMVSNPDIFIRTTAAELLGEQTASKENIEALKKAFADSLKTDKNYDDAQLAILSALVKLDKQQSNESLKLALNAPNYLLRRRAASLIEQNDLTKDFPDAEKQVGTVKPYDRKTGTKLGQILNTEADYVRAVSRRNGNVKAVFTTEKGNFTIDLQPEDAPLTVDNFIKLARKNYFNGLAVHRVVPNFVMQDGDPLGNGSGGPGWSIRCEINTAAFERGAVGMALSGKDTGGSQWFATHSPQPHLDGGYTVFGRVNETDMKIVDNIVRGDKILKVEIIESSKK